MRLFFIDSFASYSINKQMGLLSPGIYQREWQREDEATTSNKVKYFIIYSKAYHKTKICGFQVLFDRKILFWAELLPIILQI